MRFRYAVQFSTGRTLKGVGSTSVNDGHAIVIRDGDGKHEIAIRLANVEYIEFEWLEDIE